MCIIYQINESRFTSGVLYFSVFTKINVQSVSTIGSLHSEFHSVNKQNEFVINPYYTQIQCDNFHVFYRRIYIETYLLAIMS